MYKKPFLHIKFDEYGKALDYSENRHPILIPYHHYIDNADGKVSKYSLYTNGDATRYIRPNLGATLSPPFTWTAWLMKNQHNVSSYPIFMSFGLPYIACNGSANPFRLSFTSAGQKNLAGTTIPALNTWYHIAMVFGYDRTQLWANGVLEAESTTLVAEVTSSGLFDIGTHASDSSAYINNGRYDDIRIYKDVLNQAEILQVMNSKDDKKRLSFHANGDVAVKGIEEEIEWTLLDNFISDLDGGITTYDTALGGTAINNTTDLTNAGWTHSLNNIENIIYTRMKGYLQMYIGGTGTGYIQKTLPAGYDWVKVKWGNWYGGADTKIIINGVTQSTLEASEGRAEYVGEYTGTPTLRIEETTGIFWASEVWVGKNKPNPPLFQDDRRQPAHFVYDGYSPNQCDYSVWTEGVGTVGSFLSNGDQTENHRVRMPDPWNKPTIVWECRPDAVSGADGGWNYSVPSIDNTKMYRYSVWVRRNMITDGRFYHGCNGFGSVDGVLRRSDGTNQTNPYFWNSIVVFIPYRWFLVVGHIWPVGSGTGANHSDSGVYTTNGLYIDINHDYVWRPETTSGRVRTYLYYSTNTAQRQWLVYPLLEVCDGTEVPLVDLLQGRAYGPSGKVKGTTLSLENTSQLILDNEIHLKGKLLMD